MSIALLYGGARFTKLVSQTQWSDPWSGPWSGPVRSDPDFVDADIITTKFLTAFSGLDQAFSHLFHPFALGQ